MVKRCLGARIPVSVITELGKFCRARGVVMNHFITEAIMEKLKEAEEDEEDAATVEARKNEPSMSEAEWNSYLKNRGISV